MYVADGSENGRRYEFANSDEVADAYQNYFHLPRYPVSQALAILAEAYGVDIFRR
jgi:hypothetical protein